MKSSRICRKAAVDGILQIKRGDERFRKGVQHHQFAVAPADFLFGAAALRNIKEKSLIGSHAALGVAHSRGGFADGPDFAIFAADFKFEVVDRAVLLQKLI